MRVLGRSIHGALALQLRSRLISESLGHQDSGIMDDRRVGWGDAGAVGVVVAGRQGSDPTSVPFGWVAGDTIDGFGEIEMALRRAGKVYVLGANSTDVFNSWGKTLLG